MRCTKTVYEESTKIGPYFEVHCRYTDYDGKDVGDAAHMTVLLQKRDFGAENPANIMDLGIFPRKYIDDDSLEAKYEKRGERFLDLRGCSVQGYDGLAQYLKDPPWSWWDYDMADASAVWLPYTVRPYIIEGISQYAILIEPGLRKRGESFSTEQPSRRIIPPRRPGSPKRSPSRFSVLHS